MKKYKICIQFKELTAPSVTEIIEAKSFFEVIEKIKQNHSLAKSIKNMHSMLVIKNN